MPAALETVHHVSEVLTSQPGKLKIKDLKAALEEKQGKEGEISGRQMLEASFVKQLSEEMEREKNKEIRPALANCKVQTMGDALKTDAELRAISDARETCITNAINAQRAEGRQRSKTEATNGRPVHNAKAFPTFYQPSWDLQNEPESNKQPAIQQVRTQLVKVSASLLLKHRLASRIGAIRSHLASFSSKEEITAAIKATTHSGLDNTVWGVEKTLLEFQISLHSHSSRRRNFQHQILSLPRISLRSTTSQHCPSKYPNTLS